MHTHTHSFSQSPLRWVSWDGYGKQKNQIIVLSTSWDPSQEKREINRTLKKKKRLSKCPILLKSAKWVTFRWRPSGILDRRLASDTRLNSADGNLYHGLFNRSASFSKHSSTSVEHNPTDHQDRGGLNGIYVRAPEIRQPFTSPSTVHHIIFLIFLLYFSLFGYNLY